MNSATSEQSHSRLTCQRAAFDLPEEICWLNSAYMSPLLHTVKQAGLEGLNLRSQPWKIRSEDFFAPADQLRHLFAELIHADAEGVALLPAVSYGVATAAKNLHFHYGQNIVVVEEQFPSNIYTWREVARQNQLEIRTVKIPANQQWNDAILNQIDSSTALVAIPHIHWTTGAQFDLQRISEKVHQLGGALLVDATQSLGALPFDVQQIQPDFLLATAYKCLLGPYGLTYCYLAEKYRNGSPLEEGWLNRANAADFSQLTHYCDQYMPGARRFDMGERANSILLPMAIASLEQLLEWKISRIQQYTRPLIEQIIERADRLRMKHPPLSGCSPCMVGVELPEQLPQDLTQRLIEEQIYVSIRLRNMRVATHIYNTPEEVQRLFDFLESAR